MKLVYHPGTGTLIDAAECMIIDSRDLDAEAATFAEDVDTEYVLANVDIVGLDLGVLLDAMGNLGRWQHGVTVSQFGESK